MTPKQQKRLGEYVRWIADEIELRDWTFIIDRDPPEVRDALGFIECVYGRKLGTLAVCRRFFDLPPNQQRQVVCHELIHCHFAPTEWAINNAQTALGEAAFTLYKNGYRGTLEYGIDALADAIAKHMPLPKWTSKEKS